MSDEKFRGLKAVLKNGVLWGLLCGALGGGLVGLYALIFAGPGVESLPERIGEALFAGVGMGVRFALAGAVIGTLFASLLRFGFGGRRVAELNIWRFALLGAAVGGVGIPLFYQLMNVLTDGHMISWGLVTDDSIWASIFGAGAAAGTIWMARRATVASGEGDQHRLGEPTPLGAEAQLREGAGVKGRSSE